MNRTLALVALALLLAGCTRYSTRMNGMNGPFARKPSFNRNILIPPGPPANNSPLALASNEQPEPPQPPNQNLIIPPRTSEPVAIGKGSAPTGDVTPAGGITPDDAAFPPLDRRRRPEPQPGQLPTPFAPKDAANPPKNPAVDPTQTAARNIAEVKKLVAAATEKWEKVDCYEAVVTRRELAPNKIMNDDVVLYQFRKEPMSVYIRNLGESAKGRELLYSPAKHGDKIHAVVGQGDGGVLLKAGARAPSLSPDNPLVKDKTRYSIREAGYATPIARVAEWAAKAEAGKIPADALTYLGPVARPEFKHPVVGVQLRLRAGDDPLLPNGGVRQWFFEKEPDAPANGFPVLIIATEANGKEVEYYLFEKLNFGIKFTDADFSPDRLHGKKR